MRVQFSTSGRGKSHDVAECVALGGCIQLYGERPVTVYFETKNELIETALAMLGKMTPDDLSKYAVPLRQITNMAEIIAES